MRPAAESSSSAPLRVLFYPQRPRPEAAVTKICARLGYTIVTAPHERFDIALFWTTRTVRRLNATLAAVAIQAPVLNAGCHDIGKRCVDRVFQSVFGYSSLLDPRSHHGICVRKSNLNATHDGAIVKCPLRRVQRRYVYQRLIDNLVEGAFVEDLRTPVLGDEIPFVFVDRRPVRSRFYGTRAPVAVATRQVFSSQEIDGILSFCRLMGLDYGDLDILRDHDSGRIVIIDANPTPWPPRVLRPGTIDARRLLAESFEQLLRDTIRTVEARRTEATPVGSFQHP